MAKKEDLVQRGTVKIHFEITQEGSVRDVHVISGDPKSLLAKISVAAIKRADIPPIPPEIAATLTDRVMIADYDFSEY